MNKFSQISRKQIMSSIERDNSFSPDLLPSKVKELRKALGLTQVQMAARLGIKQSSYMRIEQNLDSSGLKTISRFLNALNCDLGLQIKPRQPFTRFIKERAVKKAEALLGRTYGNMALEKQSPDTKTYEKRLKELVNEFVSNPRSSLWAD